MQDSSFETRDLDIELSRDFDSTLMDGLEEEPAELVMRWLRKQYWKSRKMNKIFARGEIYLANLNPSKGAGIGKIRPVLVI